MRFRSAAVRDIVTLAAVFALLLGGLYAFTGNWPPAVIVESGSMMHRDTDVTYGRVGTIDPGDLVLVKNIETADDVTTLVEGGRDRYGMPGDVIVFYPRNDRGRTPIIHRAIAYVELAGSGDDITYRVRWPADKACEGDATKDGGWCVYGSSGVYIPSARVSRVGSTPAHPQPYKPEHDGFITKGDNPFSNNHIDQVSGLSPAVRVEWVEGKGRAELPWLGLVKLSLAGRPNEQNPPSAWVKIGSAYAPKDLWVMLGASLFVLVGIPLIYDTYRAIRARRERPELAEVAPASTTGADDGDSPPGDPTASDEDDAPRPPGSA